MSADDWVKVIGAVSGALVIVLGAIGVLWAKVHGYSTQVDGRLTELLDLTRKSSKAEGILQGKSDLEPAKGSPLHGSLMAEHLSIRDVDPDLWFNRE